MLSKWQPSFYVLVSLQKLLLWVAVIASSAQQPACPRAFSALHEYQVPVASFIWDLAVLLAGVCVCCCDRLACFSPALRRWAYGMLVLCLFVDATGSYLWGNTSAVQIAASVGGVRLALDNYISSSSASQLLIALHLFLVSIRSSRGRAWAYASLRFAIDLEGSSSALGRSMPVLCSQQQRAEYNAPPSRMPLLESSPNGLQHSAEAALAPALSRLHSRWQLFQQRQLVRCGVFHIPCVARTGAPSEFELARPLFQSRLLLKMGSVADAHPTKFAIVFGLIGVLSATCTFFDASALGRFITLVLNVLNIACLSAIMSSNRYNVDRVAVKHVAMSFRYALCVLLLLQYNALNVRKAILQLDSAWTPPATALMSMLFLQSAFLDCCPNFSPTAHVFLSVTIPSSQLNNAARDEKASFCRLWASCFLDASFC
jgi:hypothetical protein